MTSTTADAAGTPRLDLMASDVEASYSARADEYTEQLGSMFEVHPSDVQLVTAWAEQVDGTLLDAGCGPGHWTSYLAGRRCRSRFGRTSPPGEGSAPASGLQEEPRPGNGPSGGTATELSSRSTPKACTARPQAPRHSVKLYSEVSKELYAS